MIIVYYTPSPILTIKAPTSENKALQSDSFFFTIAASGVVYCLHGCQKFYARTYDSLAVDPVRTLQKQQTVSKLAKRLYDPVDPVKPHDMP